MTRLAITGATGFVGSLLVPALEAHGLHLLLIGRNRGRLQRAFPGHQVAVYEDLAEAGRGCDMLVHLAVLNNNVRAPADDFEAVNVGLLQSTLQAAKKAGVRKFVNVSSTHALDGQTHHPYARSKRLAADWLRGVEGMETVTVYLPMVYGSVWPGRLSWLNRLPGPLAGAVFRVLAALKPTVHVARLADFIAEGAVHAAGGETVLSDGQRDNSVFCAIKRAIDLAFAIAVIVLFWWLLVLIAVLIRLDTRGPAIYAQERVGQGERSFTCYKFRTMKTGTAQAGTHEVSADAVTRFGRFLRRSKLDELPQVMNILRNEVSLVGPRPCLPVQRELVAARRRRGVYEIKPGITGLSQVKGIDMSDPERLARWDARYVALQSLMLDLRIMVQTLLGKGRGDRVR